MDQLETPQLNKIPVLTIDFFFLMISSPHNAKVKHVSVIHKVPQIEDE